MRSFAELLDELPRPPGGVARTPPLPCAWPMTRDTRVTVYAFTIAEDEGADVGAEISAPWAAVTYDLRGAGPATIERFEPGPMNGRRLRERPGVGAYAEQGPLQGALRAAARGDRAAIEALANDLSFFFVFHPTLEAFVAARHAAVFGWLELASPYPPAPPREATPAQRAVDPWTPIAELERLAATHVGKDEAPVRRALLQNVACTPEVVALVATRGASRSMPRSSRAIPCWDELRTAAVDPWTSPAALRALLAVEHMGHHIAANPSVPVDVLEVLARRNDDRCRLAVVASPAVTPDILEALASSSSSLVARTIAAHPRASGPLLGWLAIHEIPEVRAAARANPNLPDVARAALDALDQVPDAPPLDPSFAEHLARVVGWARVPLAAHPATPPETLARFALLPYALGPDARKALRTLEVIAAHPAVPTEVLMLLATHDEATVRIAAARGDRLPPAWVEHLRTLGYSADLSEVAPIPDDVDPAPAILALMDLRARRLPVSGTPIGLPAAIVAIVSRSPRIDMIVAFARHETPLLRTVAAMNRALPGEILVALARDAAVVVRHAVAANPSSPEAALRVVAEAGGSDVPGFLAGNPATPEDVLRSLASTTDEVVARAIEDHPNTPPEIRTRLAEEREARELERSQIYVY